MTSAPFKILRKESLGPNELHLTFIKKGKQDMHVYVQGGSQWLDEPIKTFIKKHVPNAHVVELWKAKRPGSILATNVPLTVRLSLDYAERVNDSLTEADDLALMHSLTNNENKPVTEREWWILKPSLVDCGAGIRLFSTEDELASHLESIEDEGEGSEEPGSEISADGHFHPTVTPPCAEWCNIPAAAARDTSVDDEGQVNRKWQPYLFTADDRIPSSMMREFVAQRYISSIVPIDGRKWHVRAYVLVLGRMKVYVFRDMLALLAPEVYEHPWLNQDPRTFLTNTSLQNEEEIATMGARRDFWSLPDDLLPCDRRGGHPGWKENVFQQIRTVSADLVRGAAHTMPDKFVLIDKCFELFGVDFLVDANGTAWLLEVNGMPDLYWEGVARQISLRLMESTVDVAMEYMNLAQTEDKDYAEAKHGWVEVLDESNALAKSRITKII